MEALLSPWVEVGLMLALLGTTAWWLTRGRPPWIRLAATAIALALLVPLVAGWRASTPAPSPHLPHQTSDDRFASSRSCRSCHPTSHATWSKTYHRTMTQVVSPETLAATWSGTLEHGDLKYELRSRDGRYFIEMPRHGTMGVRPEDRIEREVLMSTGSHHQQLYWYAVPWADRPPARGGATLYANRCAACHGARGEGTLTEGRVVGRLRGEEAHPGEVMQALGDARHQGAAPLDSRELAALLDHVERMEMRSRLMQFPFAWLIADRRWVHESFTFLDPPSEQEPEGGPEAYEQGWSHACDQCHSANASFKASGEGPGRAEVADLGIACENCHGPAAAHVRFRQAPWNRYLNRAPPPDDVVVPTDLDPAQSAAICGRCHGDLVDREDAPKRGFRPGDRLEDHVWVVQRDLERFPAPIRREILSDPERIDGGYWDDGTVRVVGRDYNGLALTACHTRGAMTCTTCHSMHDAPVSDQLKPEAQGGGDAMCSSCHQQLEAQHSHHPPPEQGGPGCYDCHMPRTTWGLLGAIHAHRVDSPRSERMWGNRPSACVLCHADRSRGELAETLSEAWGQPRTPVPDLPTVLTGRSGLLELALRGDAVQRGVAAVALGRPETRTSGRAGVAPLARVLAELLLDPYTAVRHAAVDAFGALPGFEDLGRVDYLGSEAERRAARDTAAKRAAAMVRARRTDRRLFLLEGRFDDAAIQATLRHRDDRPVSVNE